MGGGPAGCAAALTLRRYLPHLDVCLVTAPPAKETPAVGETLSPGVPPLLEYLGVREDFLRQGHLPSEGTASAWGSPKVTSRNYLFTGRGRGWHLDRAVFDDWLLSRAEMAGVRLLRSRATSAVRSEGCWHIEMDGGEPVSADTVIDAGGRSAWLSRRQNIGSHRDDALVADARWFQHDRDEAGSDGALVESTPEGWWYSATLPGRRGVAMFMTDADLRQKTPWEDRLRDAPATAVRLAAWSTTGEAQVRAAFSQCSDAVAGEGWVAAGDAAAAFDPISSLGIGFSLRSGMEAARVAVASREGDAKAAQDYRESVERIYADYRDRLRNIYQSERRWTDHPFWSRRR